MEQKGHKSGRYKALTVGLWFGGEIVGAIIGFAVTGVNSSSQFVPYLVALLGAVIGAGIAFAIANNLSPMMSNPLPESPGTTRNEK